MPVLGKKSCSNNNLERLSDATGSNGALAGESRLPVMAAREIPACKFMELNENR
jgi:hypothetical protein